MFFLEPQMQQISIWKKNHSKAEHVYEPLLVTSDDDVLEHQTTDDVW